MGWDIMLKRTRRVALFVECLVFLSMASRVFMLLSDGMYAPRDIRSG